MVKKLFLIALTIFVSVCSFSQEKKDTSSNGKKPMESKKSAYKRGPVVKEYRTFMKSSNYTKAIDVIDNAMKKHPDAHSDAVLYKYKADAIEQQIVAENKKIYLNYKPDTAQYFNYMLKCFETGFICDSIERSVGEVKYSKDIATKLVPYISKIYNAGKYYYMKKDFARAYRFINMYSTVKSSDMYDGNLKDENSSYDNSPEQLATLAVLSAYGSNNYSAVMKYLPSALENKTLENEILEIGSKSALAVGDSLEMINLLENGFVLYPNNDFYFISLIKYYNEGGEYEKAYQAASKMTELKSNNRDYWYVRGKEESFLQKYDDALASFAQCVEIKADDAEAYSSIGNLYLQKAHLKYSRSNLTINDPKFLKEKSEINELYQNSCDAFEKCKLYDEANKDLWLVGLRETYFKLNKGKELKSLEKYK